MFISASSTSTSLSAEGEFCHPDTKLRAGLVVTCRLGRGDLGGFSPNKFLPSCDDCLSAKFGREGPRCPPRPQVAPVCGRSNGLSGSASAKRLNAGDLLSTSNAVWPTTSCKNMFARRARSKSTTSVGERSTFGVVNDFLIACLLSICLVSLIFYCIKKKNKVINF
eukprot:m.246397 g.246397  ORF g.246397 m.246397 type:complete len:166 (+) comp26646_c0_seq21:187-684(+)